MMAEYQAAADFQDLGPVGVQRARYFGTKLPLMTGHTYVTLLLECRWLLVSLATLSLHLHDLLHNLLLLYEKCPDDPTKSSNNT